MDETSSLLSALVQTKSIERVLTPIASQVSYLVLQNEAYEQGDQTAFPADLECRAVQVNKSSRQLIDAAHVVLTETVDQEVIQQMPKACDSLAVASETLVTASQRLYAENYSSAARRHLISSSKHVLEGTLKVLMVSDDAEVRRIVTCCHDVTQQLMNLTAITHMSTLVTSFKAFSEEVMRLTKQVEKRQSELVDRQQRESVITCMKTLKKSLPMLSTALQTYVKYPSSSQAISSKTLSTGQITDCLRQIKSLLQYKQSVKSLDETDEPGHFVLTMDKILDALSGTRRFQMVCTESDLDQHIGAVIGHCMSVAHFSHDKRKKHIVTSCQNVLQQRNALGDFVQVVISSTQDAQLRQEFNASCDHLVHTLQKLEEDISLAVLHLVCDVFKESTEPIERLVRAGLAQPRMDDACIQDYAESFHTHSDALCQVARFLAAACPHPKKVRELRSCVMQLEHLDPEILPAVTACMHTACNPDNEPRLGMQQISKIGQDPGKQPNPGATQHLKLLKREWNINIDLLIESIDDVIDKDTFMEITETKVRDGIRECRNSRSMPLEGLTRNTRAVAGSARRVATVAKIIAESSDDVIRRHKINKTISKFKKNIQDFKSSVSHVMCQSAIYEQHETLHQHCDSLLAGLARVMSALTTERDSILHAEQILDLGQNGGEEKVSESVAHRNLMDVPDMSSQISLQGIKLNGQLWNGKENGFFKPAMSTSDAQTSIKSFCPEHKHPTLEELCRSLISSATSGNKNRLDLLINDWLKWTNHSTDLVKHLTPLLTNQKLKDNLEDASSQVQPDIADCLEMADKLVHCDTSCLDRLHDTAQHWANTISYILQEVDKVVELWLIYSNKIISSAREKNYKLINAQMTLLRKHVASTQEISHSAQLLASAHAHTDVHTVRHTQLLQDRSQHLNALTTQLQATSNADTEVDISQLERTSRDWAVTVFISLRISRLLSTHNIALFKRAQAHTDTTDSLGLKREINQYSQDTLRIKALVLEIEERLKNESVKQLTEQLEKVLLCMEDCFTLISTVVSITKQHEKTYAPYNILLLKWTWCNKVHEILQSISTLSEHNFTIQPFISDTSELKDKLTAHMSKVQSKALEVMKPCHATDQRLVVQDTLRDLDTLVHHLCNTTDSADERIKVMCMSHRWNVLCHHLTSQLRHIHTTNQTALRDLHKILEGPHVEPSRVVSPSVEHRDDSRVQNMSTASGDIITHSDLHKSSRVETNSKDKGVRHSYAPPTQPKQTVETSWQELRKAPQVQHSTPETQKSTTTFVKLKKTPKPPRDVLLPAEIERWEDDSNPIIQVARQIATHVAQMDAYLKGQGTIKDHAEVISTAKTVAKKSEKLGKFARILVDHSLDKRCADNLLHHCNKTPMLIAQLYIISAGNEASSADDQTTERMLVNTARNLVDAFSTMLTAAEAICVQGMRKPAPEAGDEIEAVIMATQWKLKLGEHRSQHSAHALKDDLGLRKVTQTTRAPPLNHIMDNKI